MRTIVKITTTTFIALDVTTDAVGVRTVFELAATFMRRDPDVTFEQAVAQAAIEFAALREPSQRGSLANCGAHSGEIVEVGDDVSFRLGQRHACTRSARRLLTESLSASRIAVRMLCTNSSRTCSVPGSRPNCSR